MEVKEADCLPGTHDAEAPPILIASPLAEEPANAEVEFERMSEHKPKKQIKRVNHLRKQPPLPERQGRQVSTNLKHSFS